MTKMRTNWRLFAKSLDVVAPVKTVQLRIRSIKVREFFGHKLRTKKEIIDWTKTMPQLADGISTYREAFDKYPDKCRYDLALVLWAGALRAGDFEYADRIRAKAAENGTLMSRFKGNVLMRTP